MATLELTCVWLGLLLLPDSTEFSDRRLHLCSRDLSAGRDDRFIRHQAKFEFYAFISHHSHWRYPWMSHGLASFALLSSFVSRSAHPTRPIHNPLTKILLREFQQPKAAVLCFRSCFFPAGFIWLSGENWRWNSTWSAGFGAKGQNPKPLENSSC